MDITPVILAGGYGTRLWPLSRKSYPKQFSKIIGDESLFQKTAKRLTSSKDVSFTKHLTLTNSNFRFIVVEQLQLSQIDPGPILIEPESKNTAPAILLASLFAMESNPEAVLLVAPSDHVIPEINEFHKSVAAGISEIEQGKIVTFGIIPTRPETGYGYLELESLAYEDGPIKVNRFVEKPNHETARSMIEAGNYLWNAGIFMFRAQDMVTAFRKFNNTLFKQVASTISKGRADLGFFRPDALEWSKCENISLDYAIMEHASNIVAVPYSAKWSDLGGWDAVGQEMGEDQNGVSLSKNALAIDCRNTLLRSESENQEIVGLGLENIIAIAMPDAVLVAHKTQAQNVKRVVEMLKLSGVEQAEVYPKDHRPWGWFESLAHQSGFQVKLIQVNSGASLSLQSHKQRSEHWVVVKGTANVTINSEVKSINEGESVFIPLGAIHRMENLGREPLVLIEVQIGAYLGEDDIVRYEDIYSRT